ncbi:MAG: hypothetical protein E3K36_08585 [Candidatus Brocadia sp.]|nr:hypothetical protein [Candidatus Brocadia sp.]
MSENFERQKELSKRVLIPGEPKPAARKATGQIQLAPMQLLYIFSFGAIVGFAIFVVIWIIAGFSKWTITLPFIAGFFGVAIEMIRRKYKV